VQVGNIYKLTCILVLIIAPESCAYRCVTDIIRYFHLKAIHFIAILRCMELSERCIKTLEAEGENAWVTFARPFEQFLELVKRNGKKVYCSCKEYKYYGII